MPDPHVVSVKPDRAEGVYQVNSRIAFQIDVSLHGASVTEGAVGYVVRQNLGRVLSEGVLPLGEKSREVSASLAEPGIVSCHVTFTAPGGAPVTAAVGAAVDPWDIRPSMPPPEDFNRFWDAQLARLAGVPLAAELTPVPSWNEQIECFDTRVQCAGEVPVSGYFARPRDARTGSLPAILVVPGAGVRSASCVTAIHCAQRNWLALDINAHGLPNGRPDAYYAGIAANELADYRVRGSDDPQTSYFVAMFLRVRRALDFLTSQPSWNGKVLTVHGHSQGGYQSIAGAALDQRVTAFGSGIPGGCDLTGDVVGRPSGWPRSADDSTGALREKRKQAARYIDAVNLITRTRAEAFFTVGCIDATCNPAGVYAAYNNHPGPKQMIHCPAMGHESSPDIDGALTRCLLEHARRVAAR